MPDDHEELRAKRLVIVDDQGRDRMELTTKDGAAHISVLHPSGKGGVQITVSQDRMALGLYGADEASRVLLRFDAEKDAASVTTSEGAFLASLTATRENASVVAAHEENPSAIMHVRRDVAWVGTFDKSGKERLL